MVVFCRISIVCPHLPLVAIDFASCSAQPTADALLVTNFKNVTYLTGFTGDDSYLAGSW